MDSFHRLVTRRIQALRAEGEEARASRLETTLAHVDKVLAEGDLSEGNP